jgi:hypothetical protein
MLPPRILGALIGLITLSACFYSEVALIPPGAQVTLPYNGVVLCLDDDCRIVMADEDGVYEISPREDEDDKPLFVRFQVLIANEDNPVYLAEAEMRDDDDQDVSYQYLVAHMRMDATTHVPTYEFAMPSCNDAPDGMLGTFGIEQADNYACRVTDLAAFKQYLIAVHKADFESEAFWKED